MLLPRLLLHTLLSRRLKSVSLSQSSGSLSTDYATSVFFKLPWGNTNTTVRLTVPPRSRRLRLHFYSSGFGNRKLLQISGHRRSTDPHELRRCFTIRSSGFLSFSSQPRVTGRFISRLEAKLRNLLSCSTLVEKKCKVMSLQAHTFTPSFCLATQKYVTLNTSVLQIGGKKEEKVTLQAMLTIHSNSEV